MKKWMIAAAFLVLPGLLLADEESRRQDVIRLMELTNASAMVDSTAAQVGAMLNNMRQELGIRPGEEEIFERHHAKMEQLMETEFTWGKLEASMVDLHLKHYSDREVKDIIAFYESDSGRSMIAKQPEVMADAIKISMGLVQGLMPKLQDLGKELQRELKAVRQQQ